VPDTHEGQAQEFGVNGVTRRRNAALGAVVALATVLAACGGGSAANEKPKATTTTAAPTTTTVTVPVAPLTGLDDASGQSHTRPALSIKVENTPEARPQAGIDQADVVYEEVVEGGITRFIAIFNSNVPQTVGPVRSVRAQDPDIVWPIGGVFVYSGGTEDNVAAINASPAKAFDENTAGNALERNSPDQPPRDAPHNLYAHPEQAFALGGGPVPPPPLFGYAPATTAPSGTPVLSMRVGFDPGYDPTWTWEGITKTWLRQIDNAPSTVVGGTQIAPANVVVQFTDYPNESNGQTVGEGDAWIFSDGTVRQGRWVRPDKAQPARYVDGAGNPILLRPGRTWVELLPNGAPVDVTAAPVPETTVPPATTVAPTTAEKKK
jgi:Protein of unknown function (DUF3048) N-terminal domain/Protein of unknown function (DUF3048) C-terminal domain